MVRNLDLGLISLLWATLSLAVPPSTTDQGTFGTNPGSPVSETLNIAFKLYELATVGAVADPSAAVRLPSLAHPHACH